MRWQSDCFLRMKYFEQMFEILRYLLHYMFKNRFDLFVFQNLFDHDDDLQRFRIRSQCFEREVDLIDRNEKALYFLFSIFDVDQQVKEDCINYRDIHRIIRIQFWEWRELRLLFLDFSSFVALSLQISFLDECRFRDRRDIDFWMIWFDNERLVIVIDFWMNWAFETFWIECIWLILDCKR